MSPCVSLVKLARRAALTLALPAALLALSACGIKVDIPSVEKSIQEGVGQQLGLAVSSVSCPPDSRPAKAGDTFECTGKAKIGGSFSVQVTQKDDQGNIEWTLTQTTGLFDMQAAEAAVAQGFKEQLDTDVKVACGERWKVGEVGDTFECAAEKADGGTLRVVLTVDDAAGNITWAAE